MYVAQQDLMGHILFGVNLCTVTVFKLCEATVELLRCVSHRLGSLDEQLFNYGITV
jgi:hypothetical protein